MKHVIKRKLNPTKPLEKMFILFKARLQKNAASLNQISDLTTTKLQNNEKLT